MTQTSTDIELTTQVRTSSGRVLADMPLGSLLIGVCGSSAAESTGELVEEALRFADKVTVVATPTAATLFVSEISVPLYTDSDWVDSPETPLHVTLLHETDTLVVAPATATTLAKVATGLADTLVTALVLAHGPGVYFQPCMNVRMWSSPSVRRTVHLLRGDGHYVLEPGPVSSRASRTVGSGVGEIPGNVVPTVVEFKRKKARLISAPTAVPA